ncbi:unnamed protein product [Rotaria socialis]|uniref:Uncharacterized protein n=1 Tax=Rotaria socialis TaxID=392032 RepID=A0A818CYX4_9BILA|nr:unnamed protein product [Rotaria socialis]CAF3438818.1 unnamed protein product [Rotaria socialis]CAF3482914.1 unnamed protein product [Rotaria socialis]CAF3729739.1 unnamed protein product [Rotaria socialis]CAF4179081.1 unnamed protein product [Rotaria socialis]
MQSSIILITALVTFFAVGFAAEYPSILIDSAIYDDIALPQSRNVFQQFLINQLVNILPINIRDGINDAAALFGMTRNEFLLRCLKELQAFQAYSKIDFITAIQKTIKYVDEKLTDEQKETLESLEQQGIAIAKLLFSNQLQSDQKTNFYDLLVKVVRETIDGATFVIDLPKLVNEILLQSN